MQPSARRVCVLIFLLVVVGLTGASQLSASTVSGAAPGSWPQPRFNAAQTAYDPYEHILNLRTVSDLDRRSAIKMLSTYPAAPPVIGGGLVITGSYQLSESPSVVEAFPVSCGRAAHPHCRPVWVAYVGSLLESQVTIADGEVFVDSSDLNKTAQVIYVFGLHCGTGGATCEPLWTATIEGGVGSLAAPTVSNGVVYVPGGEVGNAYLYAFPTDCSAVCLPLWRGQMYAGDSIWSVAVGDGFVFVPDYGGVIMAFPVGCATGGAVCQPAWTGSVDELGPGMPAVADGKVFVGSQNDQFFAFNAAGCGATSCSPVWTATTGLNVRGQPAVAYGHDFVSSDDGYVYAYPVKCARVCSPTWRAFLTTGHPDSGRSSIAVADHVVYVPWTNGISRSGISAFASDCATGGKTCKALWTSNGGSHWALEGPVVSNGQLWATGGPLNGPAVLYSFGLPRSAVSSAD